MKSSLEQKEEILSTISEDKKLKVKESNNLFFNHIDKLAADHDVTVSDTMIKITYKKTLKDQNTSEGLVDLSDPDSQSKKIKTTETGSTLTLSDISFITKSPKSHHGPVYHSTPKQPPVDAEKKKKYVNGLNLGVKSEEKSCLPKVQNGVPNVKKCKTGPSKNDLPPGKRFLKGNGLLKPKTSIVQKSRGDQKKTNGGDKKIKKLENGVRNKGEDEKRDKKIRGLKRKESSTELNVFPKCKKIKGSESQGKEENGERESEERNRTGGKKPIMLVDPDLPAGWTRFIRTKNKGSANEQYVVYVVNPQGKKFRFKWKLRRFLQRTNSTLDADQFFFGLYRRPKTSLGFEKFEEDSTDAIREGTQHQDSETSPEPENSEPGKPDESSSNDGRGSSDGKELLLFDPDLPFGWKRVIHSNNANGRKQVHIISPDGKIFRRRYRLNEYLVKHQCNYDLDRFYFGLYPKKEGNTSEKLGKEIQGKSPSLVKSWKKENSTNMAGSGAAQKVKTTATNSGNDIDINEPKGDSKFDPSQSAMYDDPNLPEGWKRFIKIRSCGESAGRMEVVIVSPDGRRHRSKKHLEHYLLKNQLKYKVKDFDFTVFGKSNVRKRPESESKPKTKPEPETITETVSEPCDLSFLSMKKKFTDKPVPELDIGSLKESVITPEGHMINTVNGLMICSGLSSARNERRQRLPRAEHEKQLKNQINSEEDAPSCEISKFWVQRLVTCRADFRNLESDAASTVAEFTNKFIKTLSLQALANSKEPEAGLKYEDVAEIVDRSECLSFLKLLIPKKITFREYIKLNRPKQFMSFT